MAEGICGYLERNHYRCFVAYRDIPRGVVWASAITDAIDASRIMVVVFSEHFNVSPQTDREIELASENQMPILTYRITNAKFTGAKKYYLKNLNWIDAFPHPEQYFQKLMDSVRALIGDSPYHIEEERRKAEEERRREEEIKRKAEKEWIRQEQQRKAEEAKRKAEEEKQRREKEPLHKKNESTHWFRQISRKHLIIVGIAICVMVVAGVMIVTFDKTARTNTALNEGSIQEQDITDDRCIRTLEGHTSFVESASFSPDGKYIVSASFDEPFRIWDAVTGEQIGELLTGGTNEGPSASFSPDGKKILSVDGTIRIWNATTRKQIKIFEGVDFASASFSPDGTKIVSESCQDKIIKIWDAVTGEQIGQPLEGHTDLVSSASFSPDGKYIVSASWDETIRIWNTTTGKQIGQPLYGHTDGVLSASFSPDGKYIVSASADKTIRIWDRTTGQQIGHPLEGHTGLVSSASFSPDGKYIVSASSDETIRLWNVNTGEQIGQPLEGHTDNVRSASFSPDGKRIVSASDDHTVKIWDVSFLYD